MTAHILNTVVNADNVGNLAFPKCSKAAASYVSLLGNFLC